MSFFKKVVNGLFNGSKEKKEENSLKEAPLAYWEEFSHMLALVPENYSITEDIFENIKAIDGIEIKEKSLPSEDYPGQIVLSYKGTDFDVIKIFYRRRKRTDFKCKECLNCLYEI